MSGRKLSSTAEAKWSMSKYVLSVFLAQASSSLSFLRFAQIDS